MFRWELNRRNTKFLEGKKSTHKSNVIWNHNSCFLSIFFFFGKKRIFLPTHRQCWDASGILELEWHRMRIDSATFLFIGLCNSKWIIEFIGMSGCGTHYIFGYIKSQRKKHIWKPNSSELFVRLFSYIDSFFFSVFSLSLFRCTTSIDVERKSCQSIVILWKLMLA